MPRPCPRQPEPIAPKTACPAPSRSGLHCSRLRLHERPYVSAVHLKMIRGIEHPGAFIRLTRWRARAIRGFIMSLRPPRAQLPLATAFACVLSAAPACADIKQFRDWIAACDNLRACSAYGFDAELSGSNYIRLE